MKEPIWIDEIITKAIHKDQIIQHGGSPGIRDENLPKNKGIKPLHSWRKRKKILLANPLFYKKR